MKHQPDPMPLHVVSDTVYRMDHCLGVKQVNSASSCPGIESFPVDTFVLHLESWCRTSQVRRPIVKDESIVGKTHQDLAKRVHTVI